MNSSERSLFLAAVEGKLRRALEDDPEGGGDLDGAEALLDAARHLVLAGGKRARPWMAYVFGEAVGADRRALVDVAVAAEFIHAASLLHDDVIDAGELRRGRPTANAVWGNLAAVLSGDLVLTIALRQLQDHPAVLTREAIGVVAAMTRATMMEAAARGRLDFGPAAWRRMAHGKTGVLFGWCGSSAAWLAHDADAASRFRAAGRHLGVAFQLANDLDDLLGRTPGKDALADLHNQNPCYPVLVAIDRSRSVRRAIEAAWAAPSVHDAPQIAHAVLRTGAAEATADAIAAEIRGAESALGPYVDRPTTARLLGWARDLWTQALPQEGSACAAT